MSFWIYVVFAIALIVVAWYSYRIGVQKERKVSFLAQVHLVDVASQSLVRTSLQSINQRERIQQLTALCKKHHIPDEEINPKPDDQEPQVV